MLRTTTILHYVPGSVMYSGTSMGYFALQHNPSKPTGDTLNYTAVQCSWYSSIHIKKYIKKNPASPSSPHAELTDTCTLFQSICTDFHAKFIFFPSSPPRVAVLPWAAGMLAYFTEHSDRMLWHPPLFLLFDRSGIVSWADVLALKLFLEATWGTPRIQTDSSEGIRFALLSLAGLWQQRQRAVFSLDLWWINETNHSANKCIFF